MIDVFEYDSWKKWKTLLLLWAVHGNETCGTFAINKLIIQITAWEITITSWKLLCIPVCNPKAYENNCRLIEENLNRAYKPWWKPDSYEWKLAEEIRSYIDQSDYVLDIHSIPDWDDCFVFQSDDNDDLVNKFAQATGFPVILSWRSNLFDDVWERASEDYALYAWKKWICIECGNHGSFEAPKRAYSAIINCMKYLSLIEWTPKEFSKQTIILLTEVKYKLKSWTFIKSFVHWDQFMAWDIVIQYDDWTFETAPYDEAILILPVTEQDIWYEWYLRWKKSIS